MNAKELAGDVLSAGIYCVKNQGFADPAASLRLLQRGLDLLVVLAGPTESEPLLMAGFVAEILALAVARLSRSGADPATFRETFRDALALAAQLAQEVSPRNFE